MTNQLFSRFWELPKEESQDSDNIEKKNKDTNTLKENTITINLDQMDSTMPNIVYTNIQNEYHYPTTHKFDAIIYPSEVIIKELNDLFINGNDTSSLEPEQKYTLQKGQVITNIAWDLAYMQISQLKNMSYLKEITNHGKNILKNTTFSEKLKNIFKDYTFKAKSHEYIFSDKVTNYEEIVEIIEQSFSFLLKKQISNIFIRKNKSDNLEIFPNSAEETKGISLQTLATMIGKGITTSCQNTYILFNNTLVETEDDYKFNQKNEFFHEKILPKLQNIYNRIINKTFDIKELDALILPRMFTSSEERQLYFDLLQCSFYESGIAGDRYSKENIEIYTQLYEKSTRIFLREGSSILSILRENNLITIIDNYRNVPHIELTETLELDIITSSTFFKPYVSKSNVKVLPEVFHIYLFLHIKKIININLRKIFMRYFLK